MLQRLALVAALVGATASSSAASSPWPVRDGLLVFSCSGCPGAETGARLFTLRPDGTRLRMLGGTDVAYEPRWSPDGRRIAFTHGFRRIELVSADGSDRRVVTHPIRQAEDTSPAWSPRGKRIAFVRVRPGLGLELRAIRPDGSRPRRLATALVSPDWSPDGREIAGSSTGDGERMWVVDAAGSERRRLGPKGLVGREPRWSPDGTRVAFVDFDAGVFRLLDLRTGRVRTLLGFGSFWAHAWSPDGTRLALMRTVPVECNGPYECEDLELSILHLGTRQRLIVFSVPDGGEVYGLDWRRGAS